MAASSTIAIESGYPAFQQLGRRLAEASGCAAHQVQPAHWLFEVLTGRRRSQLVHLLLQERKEGALDASRLVLYSPIGPLPRRFDAEGLLRLNAQLLEGSICIEDVVGTMRWARPCLMLRTSRLLRSAKCEAMGALIVRLGCAADRLEKQLFGWDVN